MPFLSVYAASEWFSQERLEIEMQKQVTQLGWIGAAFVGMSYFSSPADAATLQSNTQKAVVSGSNNYVTQTNKQTSLDLFFFDVHLTPGQSAPNNFTNSIRSEIRQFVNNFDRFDPEIDQSIDQSARVDGNNNRVRQVSEQNIFDVFFLDPELKNSNRNPLSSGLDFDSILGDRIAAALPDVKQRNTQEANVSGKNNRVNQVNRQTAAGFFLVDLTFSTQLDEIAIRQVDDKWEDDFDFSLDEFLNDLDTNNPFDALPDSFFADNKPIVLESRNFSTNTVAVPEPSSAIAILAASMMRLGVSFRKRKKATLGTRL